MASVSVSVNVNKRELERLIRRSPTDAQRIVKERTQALRDDVARRMPKRSGDTARATRAVMRGPYDGAVEIPEVPGRFLIEGTRPHVIRPKRARALRFQGAGGWVFARIVHHPGTKPNRFAEDAARAALRPLAGLVARLFGG